MSEAATGAGSLAGSSAGASVARSRTCQVYAQGKGISHIKEKKEKITSLNFGFPLLQDFQVQGLDSVQRDLNNNRPRIEGGGGGGMEGHHHPIANAFLCENKKKHFREEGEFF